MSQDLTAYFIYLRHRSCFKWKGCSIKKTFFNVSIITPLIRNITRFSSQMAGAYIFPPPGLRSRSRSRSFLAARSRSRSRLRKKPGAGAGAGAAQRKNQEPEPEPPKLGGSGSGSLWLIIKQILKIILIFFIYNHVTSFKFLH